MTLTEDSAKLHRVVVNACLHRLRAAKIRRFVSCPTTSRTAASLAHFALG